MEKEILKYWGFDNKVTVEEENIDYSTDREKHIWNIDNKYILKASKSEQEVKNNILVAKLLSEVMIPTQKVIDTLDGQGYKKVNEKYYSVVEKIEGAVLKDYFEGDFKSRANNIGKALAKLHIGLESITNNIKKEVNILDANLIIELNGWVEEELNKYINVGAKDNTDFKILKKCIKEVKDDFPQLYKRLPRQAIHRDFQAENLIFKNNKLVGYIDFDLSQINARLFDVCYMLTESLASIFSETQMRKMWIEFAREFMKGYQSISKLNDDEIKSVRYMMYSIEMIMIAYFARDGYKDIADCNVEMINYLEELWRQEDFFKLKS